MTGADPLEAWAWRALYGTRHPLPARASALLMARLGESAAHRLLADKLATAAVLGPVGIPFPALRGLCRKGEVLRPLAEIDEGGDLFVKPRHGRGGGGTFSLTRTGGTWQMNGRSVTASALLDRLSRAAEQDDLLVQERLVAAPDLADLVVHGRPPVLRVVTARYPGAAPFLHSALLSMGVPSSHPAHFLRGAVYAAVDPATGQLADGLSLGEPGERMTTLPWNGAPLTGRPLVALDGAVSIALRAMAALPPLPVVHWDFIPAVSGPVLLEGNTSGNWILACLPGLFGLEACPLTPMLASWRAAPPTGHPRSA
ncbi:sugar-transfer associated ATP-grasp domain-containing protein [Ancylobacter rudongensis]|nr:sugar-transfer associated ATP-grasp domain-containing protein [Ancylobacter rudongensis]